MHLNDLQEVAPRSSASVHSFVNILLVSYVLDNVGGPVQPLRISVRNLEAELVLHGHDNFDVIERVQAQIIYKMRISRELQRKTVQLEDILESDLGALWSTLVASILSYSFSTSRTRSVISFLVSGSLSE